ERCSGLEVAQLVLERWLERRCLSGQVDGGEAAAVRPDRAVVGDRIRFGLVGRVSRARSIRGRDKGATTTGQSNGPRTACERFHCACKSGKTFMWNTGSSDHWRWSRGVSRSRLAV